MRLQSKCGRIDRVESSEALRQLETDLVWAFADVMALTVDSRDPLSTVKVSGPLAGETRRIVCSDDRPESRQLGHM
jgi:hypothetical protein